jgi:hypothetical protein
MHNLQERRLSMACPKRILRPLLDKVRDTVRRYADHDIIGGTLRPAKMDNARFAPSFLKGKHVNSRPSCCYGEVQLAAYLNADRKSVNCCLLLLELVERGLIHEDVLNTIVDNESPISVSGLQKLAKKIKEDSAV